MELCEDEIIVPAESAAHMWMDRFIKQYKYGIDEGVTVKHGKITWTGDWSEHSIYLNKDRFIIDGNEIFINAELWKKYLRMRELCGAVYVRAPRKIAFPDDWSELSDERILENIQYLEKNYKKYNITVQDTDTVKIDNITIYRDGGGATHRTCFTINNKKYYRHESIGKEIIELTHLCKMHCLPLKTKAKNWWQDNKDVLEITVLIIGLFGAVSGLVWLSDKSEKKSKEQFKQEVIKEAIDSLRKEQQKTINHKDSVKVR